MILTSLDKAEQVMRACGSIRGLWALVLIFLAGCGAETYERRLEESRRYYSYLDTLNSNLSPQAWQDAGVSIRVPRQFTLIPPPKPQDEKPKEADDAPPADADEPEGEPETVEVMEDFDPRQPDYLELELPGLMAAWQATVRTETDEGLEDRSAYLYLMSNGQLWAANKTDEANQFHKDVVQRLVEALGTPIQEKDWYEERVPSGQGYVERKAFTATRLIPDEPIDGIPMEFSIYLYQKGDVQLTLLLVVPRNVDRQEQISERTKLMLETLSVTGTRPQRPQAPAGQPQPAPSSGF